MNTIITIGRQFGSGGHEIGRLLAQELGIPCYDKELIVLAAQKSGMVVAASWLGKVKTVTQMTCILAILLEPVILPFPLFTEYHLLSYVTMAAMTVMTLSAAALVVFMQLRKRKMI